MSFNLKSLTAPLMNRVHLVTIVLGAMLFGAFRLSGGEIGMKSRTPSADRSGAAAVSDRAPAATVRRPASLERGEGELDAMLAKSPTLEFSPPTNSARRSVGDSSARVPSSVRAPSRLGEDSGDLDQLVDVGSGAGNRPAQARPRDNGGLNDIERQLGLR